MFTLSFSGFWFTRRALFVAVLVLLADCPAAAQMQIPNPLIRPRSLTNPGRTDAPADAAPARPAAPPAGTAPAAYPVAGAAGAAAAPVEDAYGRNLTELKERFSHFRVSAIVGKQAILRRFTGDQRSGGAPTQLAAVPAATGATAVASTGGTAIRGDSLMLGDGELLEMAGNSGALLAKVTSRQVTVYLVQETTILPGGKLVGKRVAVFSGEVENSGVSPVAAIVLERPDPTYKRMIAVDTKVRSASSAQDSGSAAPAASTTPAPPPQ